MTNYTPGPWIVDEFDETGGYDCMFAGIEVGPVTLDGSHYGQNPNIPMTDEQKSRMIADAHLISSVHGLLKQCNELELKIAEWEKKASTWLASSDAQKHLEGYRELARRVNAANVTIVKTEEGEV